MHAHQLGMGDQLFAYPSRPKVQSTGAGSRHNGLILETVKIVRPKMVGRGESHTESIIHEVRRQSNHTADWYNNYIALDSTRHKSASSLESTRVLGTYADVSYRFTDAWFIILCWRAMQQSDEIVGTTLITKIIVDCSARKRWVYWTHHD